MMTFAYGLVAKAGERRALAIAQADTTDAHEQLARRFKAGGLAKVRAADWNRFALGRSDCSITIEGSMHTQVHTGRSRMILATPQSVSSVGWVEVARERMPILGLVPPGSLPNVGPDRLVHGEILELLPEQLNQVADGGLLLAGFAQLLDTPAPVAGTGTRTTRL